eukprot:gene18329-18592_t
MHVTKGQDCIPVGFQKSTARTIVTTAQKPKEAVMTLKIENPSLVDPHVKKAGQAFYRFHLPHLPLGSVFGDDWFALKAEAFARFFGTPVFLIGQTIVVAIWIVVNIVGVFEFDAYPFILLNLAFSLQAAYAAPLILLAQTRQADRDKAHAVADAEHREELHKASEDRQLIAVQQTELLLQMVQKNTELTETIRGLTERVEALTADVHRAVVSGAHA